MGERTGGLSLWLRPDWSWAAVTVDSSEACVSLIWLVCGERPLKMFLLLRVRPSDSRPPGSRTCLSGPPSLSDRAASSWLLVSSIYSNCKPWVFLNGKRRLVAKVGSARSLWYKELYARSLCKVYMQGYYARSMQGQCKINDRSVRPLPHLKDKRQRNRTSLASK